MSATKSLPLALACFLSIGITPGAAQQPDELPLLGFEDADFERLAKILKLTRQDVKPKDGPTYSAWEMAGGSSMIGQWRVYKGKASQGQFAMGIGLAMRPEAEIIYSPKRFKTPLEPFAYYGLLSNPYAAPNGAILSTSGVFRRIFPIDWSAYDRLRLDVLCDGARQTIRMALEDVEIGPPIVRNVTVEPGKWTTLEMDLRAAAKERGLDLQRMATLTVGVVEIQGKAGTPPALIDNLRLCKQQVPARLPIMRDETSLALPAFYRDSKPTPEKLPPGDPDRTPLKLQAPFVIPTEKPCLVAPVGWVAAYDNQRLLLGFNAGNVIAITNVLALQSRDGGATWRGLDGATKPTGFYVNNLDHGTGRGDVVGARADVVLCTNLGCSGPMVTPLRLFARKLTFTGDGWEVREVPDLVDCDLRHCNSNQSVVRTPDGRLWAGYGMVGRLGTNQINIRYSDDDGLTWKGWAENKSGALPGSIHSEVKGVGFGVYTFEEPCLVPFEKGIACIWQDRIGYDYGPLKWARFDGKAWSAIEEIPQPKRASLTNPVARPPIHAVSLGGNDIFLTSALFQGVLHWRKGKWQAELPEAPVGSRLSAAGDKAIVVIAPTMPSGTFSKGPVALRSWQRPLNGQWSVPVDLATEQQPLSHKHDGIYVVRLSLAVQPYAPPNFVPVAWTCEGQKWIKVLRVPVTQSPE